MSSSNNLLDFSEFLDNSEIEKNNNNINSQNYLENFKT